jgi:hypothetical protein
MKIIAKTKRELLANKAESMAEVVVAFLVLTIVMTLFAQGISFSNRAEKYAVDRTRDSDKAMKDLLDTVIANHGDADDGSTIKESLNGQPNMLKLKLYIVSTGGDNCIYYVYDADLS